MAKGLSMGQRVREVRLQKKLTQSDVVGNYMTRNMLSKIENGSAAPSVKTLEYLAHTLDVPVGYFIEGEEKDAMDIEQLREIDELAKRLPDIPADCLAGLSLCIRARVRMAAGQQDSALKLLDEVDPASLPEDIQTTVYGVLEECYKMKGNYRLAYEYALKRMAVHGE